MTLGGENNYHVQDALALLDSLLPQLHMVLEQPRAVQVKLETLDILKTAKHSNSENVEAHVLYLGPGPSNDDETLRLKRVCGTTMIPSVMIILPDPTRHCTSGI